jgi:hypothetical protein
MSMTLINFIQYAKLPTKNEIESKIKGLGYNFKFLSNFEKFDSLNQMNTIKCELNGVHTVVKMHHDSALETLPDLTKFEKNASDKIFGVSLTFSSDQLIRFPIQIISIALIDLSQSIVLHANDKTFYTREMLVQENSKLIKFNGNKSSYIPKNTLTNSLKSNQKKSLEKQVENIKIFVLWGISFFITILIQKGIITWIIPIVLFVLVITLNRINLDKKNKS